MFKYRLRWADGSDAGEREFSTAVWPDEILWMGGGKRLQVLDVLPCEAGSAYTGVLVVEPI